MIGRNDAMKIGKITLTDEDYEALIKDSSNKFNSTIMDIFSQRAKDISPSTILKNYQNKHALYEPAKIDPRIYNEISNIFFDSVDSNFECIELSPINPFGLNATLTATNQNNVLSSARNSEVVSDSSIVMALECAYRIRNLKVSQVNLASSTRLLRTQKYGNGKKSHWSQHFRACSLVSSFRNTANNMFLSLQLQLDSWLKVLENLKENLDIEEINLNLCYIPLIKEIYQNYGIELDKILNNTVNPCYDIFSSYNVNLPNNISDKNEINLIKTAKDYLLSIRNTYDMFYINIIAVLKEKYHNVKFNLQLNRKSGLTYYNDICYEIEVLFKNGKSLVLIDGGINDWTGKILSDSKEKCITSGMGLEYLGKVYKKRI